MTAFTVAICTHQRAAALGRCLASLAAAEPPDGGWDVLVVLNACTDHSASVVARAAASLPVRAVAEPRPGLSHARNCAVREIDAEYVVFIDDDAVVDRGFLQAYEAAFRRWRAADVFGGPITPRFEGAPPAWLSEVLPVVGSAFAARRVNIEGAPIASGNVPFGANYALRMQRQRRHPYDVSLGRAPVGWVRGGEETAVIEAALAAGAEGRWVAGARVDHVVPPERQTADYLWRYYEGYGRLLATSGQRRTGLGARVVGTALAYRWAAATGSRAAWARALIRAAVRRGEWKARSELRPAGTAGRPGTAASR